MARKDNGGERERCCGGMFGTTIQANQTLALTGNLQMSVQQLLVGVNRELASGRNQEVPALEIHHQIDQRDHYWHFDRRPDHAANAAPELMPNTDTVTAIASSKFFDAAVNESVVVFE